MKFNGTNLKEVLDAHKRWVLQLDGCTYNDRADLIGANLYGANLYGVDLRRANLAGADLRGANLYEADLREAELRGADIRRANLRGANLRRANLRGANLREANLTRVDLRGADLYGADIYGADLRGADLYGVNIIGADFYGVNLCEAKNVPFTPMVCPDSGAFIGWKKCDQMGHNVIVKLLIPEDAKRLSGTGRKCRSDKAMVLEIQTLNGEKLEGVAMSQYDRFFFYEVGKMVTCKKPFDENRWNECSSGIHFFINRQEAVDYQ